MPSLQHLTIRDMELLDGTWESVFEALRFKRLSSFDIKSSDFLYCADIVFDEDLDRREDFFRMPWMHRYRGGWHQFFENLERYIVHGLHDLTLRHPNLQGNQATEDSLDYLGGIFHHAKQIRCVMGIDFAKVKKRVVEVCAEVPEEIRKRQNDPKG